MSLAENAGPGFGVCVGWSLVLAHISREIGQPVDKHYLLSGVTVASPNIDMAGGK